VATVIWSLILYVGLMGVFWFWLSDPWTEVGTVASLLGTAISIFTLALVSYIRRDLLAKSTLVPLLRRMRDLNAALAVRLGSFVDDPESVKQSLSMLAGLLISLENKVTGEYLVMIRAAQREITLYQRRPAWYRRTPILTENKAWAIYTSLIGIEEAIRHLVRDLQRT
jgi:hypothetical protein